MSRLVVYATAIAGTAVCLLVLFIAKRVIAGLAGGGSFSELRVRTEPRFSAILATAGVVGGLLAGILIGVSVRRETDFAAWGALFLPFVLTQLVAFPKEFHSEAEENYGLGWLAWRFIVPYSVTLVVATAIAWHLRYGIR